MDAPYIDIHTHNATTAATVIAVQAHYLHTDSLQLSKPLNQVGIHPWYLENLNSKKRHLANIAHKKQVTFIGECGLDKIKGGNWQQQLDAFSFQIELANSVRKPIVIHCVKAFAEITELLKKAQIRVPVIFHGFIGSAQMAEDLQKKGYYISFGKAILDHPKTQDALKNCESDRIFFETDVADLSITTIYKQAATLLKIPSNKLKNAIYQNFLVVTSS